MATSLSCVKGAGSVWVGREVGGAGGGEIGRTGEGSVIVRCAAR